MSDSSEGGESGAETAGQMRRRHAREERELRAKVGALQHGCRKGAPKAERDRVSAECKALSDALSARHAAERAAADAAAAAERDAAVAADAAAAAAAAAQAKAALCERQTRRRDAAAAREAAQAAARAERRLREGPTAAEREESALAEKLAALALAVRPMPADGQCLFASVADQLNARRGGCATAQSVRSAVADFIAAHPRDFEEFVGEDEATTGKKKKKQSKVQAYCERLRDTAMWGGHLELVAAARAFGAAIVVHTAADGDDLVVGPEFGVSAASPLHVSFHKHAFTLGEHYNSVVDAEPSH